MELVAKRSAPIIIQNALERDGLLDLVTTSLDDDKAEDIVAIDLAGSPSSAITW